MLSTPGQHLTEKDKEHREQFKRFFGENALEGFELTFPTKTIKDTFLLQVGGKTIELAWLGDAYISDWVGTLDRVINFDAGIYGREELLCQGKIALICSRSWILLRRNFITV